jgi:hypothetical protein
MGATYEFASTFAAKAGLEANTAMNFAEREFVAVRPEAGSRMPPVTLLAPPQSS